MLHICIYHIKGWLFSSNSVMMPMRRTSLAHIYAKPSRLLVQTTNLHPWVLKTFTSSSNLVDSGCSIDYFTLCLITSGKHDQEWYPIVNSLRFTWVNQLPVRTLLFGPTFFFNIAILKNDPFHTIVCVDTQINLCAFMLPSSLCILSTTIAV